jgi:hypothetical protein
MQVGEAIEELPGKVPVVKALESLKACAAAVVRATC